MHDRQPHYGWLEVICGSMFSGKTEEMIRRVRRARIAKQRVQVFKPAIDNRYAIEEVKSHNGLGVEALPVGSTAELLAKLRPETEVIGIDEIQFFDAPIISTVQDLANRGVRVIVAGLDMDFAEEPFGPIPGLLAIADSVEKLTGVCMQCGSDSGYISYRLISDDRQLVVGDAGEYQVRCRSCYEPPRK